MSDDKKPTPESLAVLTKWDTPTICNGLELVCPERRMCGFTTRPLVALDASLPPVIGYACTARYRSAAASVESPDVMKKRRLDYYKYLWEAPHGERYIQPFIKDWVCRQASPMARCVTYLIQHRVFNCWQETSDQVMLMGIL